MATKKADTRVVVFIHENKSTDFYLLIPSHGSSPASPIWQIGP